MRKIIVQLVPAKVEPVTNRWRAKHRGPTAGIGPYCEHPTSASTPSVRHTAGKYVPARVEGVDLGDGEAEDP